MRFLTIILGIVAEKYAAISDAAEQVVSITTKPLCRRLPNCLRARYERKNRSSRTLGTCDGRKDTFGARRTCQKSRTTAERAKNLFTNYLQTVFNCNCRRVKLDLRGSKRYSANLLFFFACICICRDCHIFCIVC